MAKNEKKEDDFKEQFQDFEKTYKDFEKMIKFVEAGKIDKPNVNKKKRRPALDRAILRAGVVKQYEFLFEMSWTTMRAFFEVEGAKMKRADAFKVINRAIEENIIAEKDAEEWLTAREMRNLSVHAYNVKSPQEIVNYSKGKFYPLVEALRLRLKEEL